LGDRNKAAVLFIATAVVIFVAVLLMVLDFANGEPKIIGRVTVEGIRVGGMSPGEAAGQLEPRVEKILEKQVCLQYGKEKWTAKFSEVGVEVNLNETIQEAVKLGRTGTVFQRIRQLLLLTTGEYTLEMPLVVNDDTFRSFLKKIALEINKAPRDARYLIKKGTVRIIPSVAGQKVNVDVALNNFKNALQEYDPELTDEITIPLAVDKIQPAVKTEDLREVKIDTLRGSYTTKFNSDHTKRVKNIITAAKALNGKVIPPGSVFSFNESVGPRTKKAGFEEALIIVEKEFVEGLGGGVCQVSTTLYNAALRANMGILERTKHSRLVGYVPVGLDAAVAYGLLDLKLVNKSEKFMVISTETGNDYLTVKILGEAGPWPQVKINRIIEETLQPKTVYEDDPEIGKGKEFVKQEGKSGYRTRVERICTQNGKMISREIVSEDIYPPRPQVILRGIKEKVEENPDLENEKNDLKKKQG